jgi:hypothetical protein
MQASLRRPSGGIAPGGLQTFPNPMLAALLSRIRARLCALSSRGSSLRRASRIDPSTSIPTLPWYVDAFDSAVDLTELLLAFVVVPIAGVS